MVGGTLLQQPADCSSARWTQSDRTKPLFFCQIEAIETAIFVTEVAPKTGVTWIADRLREESEVANPGLSRLALKMATGRERRLSWPCSSLGKR